MHGKEAVIAPKIKAAFGVHCIVPQNFDTDSLGTFSGEVERKESPLETARKKCNEAMEQTQCDLAIASEGSFGNHPTLFFVPADEEFLILLDKKNNLEIVVSYLTTETNFGGQAIESESELLKFAAQVQFPDHALILKDSEKDWSFLEKGIQSEKALLESYQKCVRMHGEAFVETDMRAMLNPMRMNTIGAATDNLIEKMHSTCPNCEIPGFDLVENQPGLPCEQCSMPTKSILNAVYRCTHCNFARIEKFPKGKTHETPMYCDFCNP